MSVAEQAQDSLFEDQDMEENKEQKSPDREPHDERKPLPGYRLDKLEVYNWGTFDGTVHSIHPHGESVLLVGENGAGKSTLVDAVLTLLVRPGVRNYNVAAGAGKRERDETSYIRGAYDKAAGEDERSRTQYLRPENNFYTVLLATFRCASNGNVFTICQVMHVATDKRTIWYAHDDKDRSISADVQGFTSVKEIKQVMQRNGWEVTDSPTTYQHWLKRRLKFRTKAMDVFNQTVAVKDVQKLDEFIRTHMLEKKPWNDKVNKLLQHFQQLSEAYQKLSEVRQQAKLLAPIIETGARHDQLDQTLQRLRLQQQALSAYFDDATVHLLEPLCEQWSRELDDLAGQLESLEKLISARHQDIAKLNVQIESQGGDRINDLKREIHQHTEIAVRKKRLRIELQALLTGAGIAAELTSQPRFEAAHAAANQRCKQLQSQVEKADADKQRVDVELHQTRQHLSTEIAELESLRKRRNNLPAYFIEVRESICTALKLAPTDLPFVAEMIAITPDELDWESSIESVLHGFARTLLVPDDLYADVSRHIDQNRLLDRNGKGMRLSYDRVNEMQVHDGSRIGSGRYLSDMLEYRPRHPLSPYVRGQIESRFCFLACDTMAEFQKSRGSAMTRNRHIKFDARRHSKDDRSEPTDRRNFVLGWDNKAKIKTLEASISELETRVSSLVEKSDHQRRLIRDADGLIHNLQRFQQHELFESIDDVLHDAEADRCRQELRRLEAANDLLQELQKQKAVLEAERAGFELDRNQVVENKATIAQHHRQATEILQKTIRRIDEQDTPPDTIVIAELAEVLPITTIDIFELQQQQNSANRQWAAKIERATRDLKPVSDELGQRMNQFLNKFPSFAADMGVKPDDLPAYRSLKAKIDEDELPQHTRRFRERLKSSVLQEIGVLNATLEQERAEIRSKIEMLNEALKPLDWERPTHEQHGSYIRLEPKDSNDAEIRSFQSELHRCLDNSMDGNDDANEQTYRRIEAFVEKLRDDNNQRWRERVVDVRNWFHFVARVYDRETNKAGAEYHGGSGKSGGEKGKLAFLVLVAAIAYQYDLKPDEENESRFHFVMVDEMFSRSDDTRARAALELFERFGLQLAIVAPLDAKARIVEDHVGMYCHIVKDAKTHHSRMLSLTAAQYDEVLANSK